MTGTPSTATSGSGSRGTRRGQRADELLVQLAVVGLGGLLGEQLLRRGDRGQRGLALELRLHARDLGGDGLLGFLLHALGALGRLGDDALLVVLGLGADAV